MLFMQAQLMVTGEAAADMVAFKMDGLRVFNLCWWSEIWCGLIA
jgi:hypothetical protein